jgi:hypothetical protein
MQVIHKQQASISRFIETSVTVGPECAKAEDFTPTDLYRFRQQFFAKIDKNSLSCGTLRQRLSDSRVSPPEEDHGHRSALRAGSAGSRRHH